MGELHSIYHWTECILHLSQTKINLIMPLLASQLFRQSVLSEKMLLSQFTGSDVKFTGRHNY